jgi:acetyl-CoA carboxylase biotin carboxyl carrier protein
MKEMNNTDLTKLEIEEEGISIRMEKEPKVSMAAVQVPTAQVSVNAPSPVAQPQITVAAAAIETAEKQPEEAEGKKVLSPMVGTFYSQSSPDKPPFVKVGDKVKKGQTLCIIEAMKLMNEIECEYDGEIVKILKNNEEMVEFGQPLFIIK